MLILFLIKEHKGQESRARLQRKEMRELLITTEMRKRKEGLSEEREETCMLS